MLYGRNCAGCHGPDGKGGVAIGLSDPVYLAIADDAAIRKVTANGVAGTSMPAFARSAGGMLTDDQIRCDCRTESGRWASPDALRDANPPPYAAPIPAMRSAERKFMGRIARHATVRRDAAGTAGLHCGWIVSCIGERPRPSDHRHCGTPRHGRSGLARRRARQADVARRCLGCRGVACRATAQKGGIR